MKSVGTLRYSPKLLGDHTSEKWWLVLDCDAGLCAYYRGLYRLFRHKTCQLMRPAWDAHITVIRNEEPPQKEPWERHAGRQVEFEYDGSLETNGDYWWLPIVSPELLEIRTELGLSDPEFPLHLSIGLAEK